MKRVTWWSRGEVSDFCAGGPGFNPWYWHRSIRLPNTSFTSDKTCISHNLGMEEKEEECRNVNPPLPVDMSGDADRMRGDAIGETLYSECWVIKVLMKLTKVCVLIAGQSWVPNIGLSFAETLDNVVSQALDNVVSQALDSLVFQAPDNLVSQSLDSLASKSLDSLVSQALGSLLDEEVWCSDLETELCLLWDMTIEEDVVWFLLNNNVLDIAKHILQDKKDPRLTSVSLSYEQEITVGIIGNLCCVPGVRLRVDCTPGLPRVLMDLLNYPDPLTLIQLMRLLKTCLVQLEGAPEDTVPTQVMVNGEGSGGRSVEDLNGCSGGSGDGQMVDPGPENEGGIDMLTLLLEPRNWLPQMVFILSSATNVGLLCSSLEMLDYLYRIMLNQYTSNSAICTTEMVAALVEAFKELQTELEVGEDDTFSSPTSNKVLLHWLSIITSFSQTPEGVIALSSYDNSISDYLCMHLRPERMSHHLSSSDVQIIMNACQVVTAFLHNNTFRIDLFSRFVAILGNITDKYCDKGEEVATRSSFEREDERNQEEKRMSESEIVCAIEHLCVTMVRCVLDSGDETKRRALSAVMKECTPHHLLVCEAALRRHGVELPGEDCLR
uniref:Uncharacterized protein n=1 Tax=Timema shepardi TaxID=629360 RepID=A0A7R9FXY8_TIMSH|nr:unnamed protein product [Timema shepardi]